MLCCFALWKYKHSHEQLLAEFCLLFYSVCFACVYVLVLYIDGANYDVKRTVYVCENEMNIPKIYH